MRKNIENVKAWAEEKGLDDVSKQYEKLLEEVAELGQELREYEEIKDTGSPMEIQDKRIDIAMEAGDVLITLINTLRPLSIDLDNCLTIAWHKIKDRDGKTINGTFVKEEDLENETK